MSPLLLLTLATVVGAVTPTWLEPQQLPVPSSTAAPLSLHVLPQSLADAFGAKCLDGTPPAMYVLKGDAKRWMVFIEGGGWCFTPDSCAGRAAGGGGSSKNNAPTMDVGGLLSPDPVVNPRFYNWSMVFIRYCDGEPGHLRYTLIYTIKR